MLKFPPSGNGKPTELSYTNSCVSEHIASSILIAERMARKHQIEAYLKNLRSREPLTEFRETDWLAMVDYIAVHSKNDILVTFKDGTEIKA